MAIDHTHDPALRCWLDSAHASDTDFPIQNLPLAVFRRRGSGAPWRGGVAIGGQVIDLLALEATRVLGATAAEALHAASGDTLNPLMALGPAAAQALREALSSALRMGSPHEAALRECLVPMDDAEFTLPTRIGDYTDFYTSVHHATNIGRLFRPDSPLLPNYKWVPIGYHGRASSVVVSGTPFRRPAGQVMAAGAAGPVLQNCARLDIELEVAVWVGAGNALGEPVPLAEAEDHIFGVGLLNDWSARDIQSWEYQPLGPFLSKNFATTVSPWIVTMQALAPFRVPFARPAGDPQPLPYLDGDTHRARGHVDMALEVLLQTRRMRESGAGPARIAASNWRHAYWTAAQMLAHHTIGGCNLQSGDLLGTGTLSGPDAGSAGALIELTAGGKQPLALPGGEQRLFLEDGDSVTLRGRCAAPGFVALGFGECTGTVLPARAMA